MSIRRQVVLLALIAGLAGGDRAVAQQASPGQAADCQERSRDKSQASLDCAIKVRPGEAGGPASGTPSATTTPSSSTSTHAKPALVERRLGRYASWDGRCRSRGAPRVTVLTPPKHGVLEIRRETWISMRTKWGTDCTGTQQTGDALYYRPKSDIDPTATSDAVLVSIHYWDHANPRWFRYSYAITLN